MATLIKNNLILFFKLLFTEWLEDLLIFTGLFIIVYTTYKYFGQTVGNYSIGFILFYIGILIAKK